MKINKYTKIFLYCFITMLVTCTDAFSQLEIPYNVSAGILTTNILGNNRAKMTIGPTNDEDANSFIGGSFKYAQIGVQVKSTFPLADIEDLSITPVFEYIWFSGRERYGRPPYSVILYKNELDIASLGFGAEYVYANLDFANAKLFAGFQFQVYDIYNQYGEENIQYLDLDTNTLFKFPPKSQAIRYGGNIKLGVEGRLDDYLYVNIGAAIGIINLLGRDDSRGELLTPFLYHEEKENYVYTGQVFILLQLNL